MGFFSFFSKERSKDGRDTANLEAGLSKTKESVFKKITRAVAGRSKVDDAVLDAIEEALVTSDVII